MPNSRATYDPQVCWYTINDIQHATGPQLFILQTFL